MYPLYHTDTSIYPFTQTYSYMGVVCVGCVCAPLMGPSGNGILFCSYMYFIRHHTGSKAENLSARLKKGDHDILNDPKYPPLPTPTPPSTILSVWCVLWCV